MLITIIYSLPTTEVKHSPYLASEYDTKVSALEVAMALRSRGEKVKLKAISTKNISAIREIKSGLIFNLIEWTGHDLEKTIESIKLLEKSSLPFTGATAVNYLLTSDKYLMKVALVKAKLPTADYQHFISGKEKIDRNLNYPLIIKLIREHCSIGLEKDSVVDNPESLRKKILETINQYHEPVIAEEFLPGREYQVTVISKNGKLIVLPPAEIKYLNGHYKFLTYQGRWDENHPDFKGTKVIRAKLSSVKLKKLKALALATFKKLNFRDYARLDLREDKKGEFMIMEINSNPGLGDDEEYGMTVSYKAAGMSFADFVWSIVQSAQSRNFKNKKLLV